MGEAAERAGGGTVRAILVAVAVVVASLFPLTWPDGRDSFPLTSYPMFSGLRTDAVVELVLAVGEGADGSEPLPTEATGHRHLTQAVRAYVAAVERGGDHPQRLCEDVAAWAGEHRPTLETVRIVTARFDGMVFLRDGDRTSDVLAEHASCPLVP